MKKQHHLRIFVILLIFAGLTATAIGQDSLPPLTKLYKIKLTAQDGTLHKGFLDNLNDSSLRLFGEDAYQRYKLGQRVNLQTFHYENIGLVTLHRKGAAGRGAWIGAIVGFVGGALAGIIEGSDPEDYWFRMTAGEKALGYGLTFGAAGAGIGAIIGALSHKKFIIKGSRERYREMHHAVRGD